MSLDDIIIIIISHKQKQSSPPYWLFFCLCSTQEKYLCMKPIYETYYASLKYQTWSVWNNNLMTLQQAEEWHTHTHILINELTCWCSRKPPGGKGRQSSGPIPPERKLQGRKNHSLGLLQSSHSLDLILQLKCHRNNWNEKLWWLMFSLSALCWKNRSHDLMGMQVVCPEDLQSRPPSLLSALLFVTY